MLVGHYWYNTLALSRWHILQPENALKYGTCAALFNMIIYHYNRFHVWSSFPLEEYGYDDKYSLCRVILLHYWLRLWWNIRNWANAVQAVYNKACNMFHSDTVFAYVDTPPNISIFYISHGRHGIRMSAPYPLPPPPWATKLDKGAAIVIIARPYKFSIRVSFGAVIQRQKRKWSLVEHSTP